MTDSDESYSLALVERERAMWLAFLAGFNWSSEGCNGEYVRSCHNMPDAGHLHNEGFLKTLLEQFADWYREDFEGHR